MWKTYWGVAMGVLGCRESAGGSSGDPGGPQPAIGGWRAWRSACGGTCWSPGAPAFFLRRRPSAARASPSAGLRAAAGLACGRLLPRRSAVGLRLALLRRLAGGGLRRQSLRRGGCAAALLLFSRAAGLLALAFSAAAPAAAGFSRLAAALAAGCALALRRPLRVGGLVFGCGLRPSSFRERPACRRGWPCCGRGWPGALRARPARAPPAPGGRDRRLRASAPRGGRGLRLLFPLRSACRPCLRIPVADRLRPRRCRRPLGASPASRARSAAAGLLASRAAPARLRLALARRALRASRRLRSVVGVAARRAASRSAARGGFAGGARRPAAGRSAAAARIAAGALRGRRRADGGSRRLASRRSRARPLAGVGVVAPGAAGAVPVVVALPAPGQSSSSVPAAVRARDRTGGRASRSGASGASSRPSRPSSSSSSSRRAPARAARRRRRWRRRRSGFARGLLRGRDVGRRRRRGGVGERRIVARDVDDLGIRRADGDLVVGVSSTTWASLLAR